ncbi:MAG: hypothetical protein QOG86_2 [Thermoleophilaceae bacterium]|nr:hypothetical protein [Thermoleophilaceae bacterium]
MGRRLDWLTGIAVGATVLVAAIPAPATASVSRVRVSSDPFSGPATGTHATEVEPDSFAAGATIIAAFQVGRFSDGGAANIGWARSTDRGVTWTHDELPGLTVAGGGAHARATDPAVAYDAKHDVWLVNSTALGAPPGIRGEAVVVNRSEDGGATWDNPVNVAIAGAGQDFDKNWIVCDGAPTSPHYGNCYVEWDDYGNGGTLLLSTSTDGGLTWGAPTPTAGNDAGLGGQPVVRPNGTVIVPYSSSNETKISAFRSTDGGTTWSAPVDIAAVAHHTPAGPMRAGALASAEINRDGRVFVAWEDCGFRTGCAANDIVFTSSIDGVTWSPVRRVPIDAATSGVDHFVPGLAVDRSTGGRSTHLGLAYHYIPNRNCGAADCLLHVGFVDSLDGGATWSRPQDLAGPMRPNWLASTADGYMTGDYISTSFSGGDPHPLIAIAHAPSGGTLDEAIYSTSPALLGPPLEARRLTKLRIRPFRFRARPSGPSIARVRGALVSYRASAAGTTRFRIQRARIRHGSRVWRKVPGRFRRTDAAGRNVFRFTGRLHGTLRPGLYRLIVEPRDAGRPRGEATSARFRIVRK